MLIYPLRDKIRIYIHRDYYDLREAPEMQLIHVGHCLDSLRQIIMCHADTELLTFEYVSEERYPNPRPNPNFLVERKCKNWDDIVAWVTDHHADLNLVESRQAWEERLGVHVWLGSSSVIARKEDVLGFQIHLSYNDLRISRSAEYPKCALIFKVDQSMISWSV